MVNTVQLEEILGQFEIKLSNYEIVNIDEKKGWSAKYLYLIVEKNRQFILKGKSNNQIAGVLDEIIISSYLNSHGFTVRTPIKTKTNEYHLLKNDIYWDLKTYIPAAVLNFSEYNNETVNSLASLNTQYIKASLNDPSIKNLGIKTKDYSDISETLENIILYHNILENVLGNTPKLFLEWFIFAQKEVKEILNTNKDFSIIHNDLNNKNILVDLDSMKVVSFIDWDHGCISTPLKDIIEPINMFYEFAPQSYEQMRSEYLGAIKANYTITIPDSKLIFLQVYFYTLNKWNYILTFAKLISELGNSTNEKADFENVIKNQILKLNEIGKKYNIY